jgi:small GTP-binding protein
MVSLSNTLEGPLAALREREVILLTQIAASLAEMGDATDEDRKRLADMARDLRDLFFIVSIIGEFNAGKSTFVNALLGDSLLPTGITPTTEMIELIRYGETPNRKPVNRDDSVREWVHPNTGAPGVAIVDTPGTGSVFQRHEKTAKEFLHRSDLVIFLLTAKRAFAETERLYLEMAKDFGKKIILVVNQIDLLAPAEQEQVRRFIEQQVKELLGLQPLLFMVSAKEALAAANNGASQIDAGGMGAVRAHLRGVFAEAPPAQQKLTAQLDTAVKIVERYLKLVQGKADLVREDTAKVREVQLELKEQSLGLDAQLKEASVEIDNVFDGLRQRGKAFIDSNLTIRKIGRSVNRDKLQAEFQDVVIGRALRDINEATTGYINAVIDQSRLYWRSVIDRLNKLQELLEQEISGLDASVYAEQRESLQDAIRIAEAELKSYSSGRVVDEIRQNFQINMNGFTTSALFAGGGLVATVLAISAPGPVLGAGAAAAASIAFVIAAPLAAVGSIAAIRYYRRISSNLKKDFEARVDRLATTYRAALDDLTRKERNRLSQYGTQTLTPIFSRLETLAKRYAEQQAEFEEYQRESASLRDDLQESSS